MNRNEFIKKLKEALSEFLDINAVNNQINYYDDYISNEISKGRTEKEVLEELGDPRLIAKTIKTVNNNSNTVKASGESYNNSNAYERDSNRSGYKNIYREYSGGTGVIGCAIVFLIIFIIVMGLLRFFGNVAFGLGTLAVSGPIGFLLVVLLFILLFRGGKR